MKPRAVAVAVLVLAGTAVCARLGLWQASRLLEKQRLNAALRAAIAAPALDHGDRLRPRAEVDHRRVRLAGRFDESRQVLLTGRFVDGEPGVDVVTPLLLAGDSLAVPVLRGWLAADDPAVADLASHREPARRVVLGFASAPAPPLRRFPWRTVRADSPWVWSTRGFDADSLRPRVPYAVAPYVVRELPGPGVPAAPRRSAPEPYDEFPHLSYAIQWFAFGAILLAGSGWLAWARRRARSPGGRR